MKLYMIKNNVKILSNTIKIRYSALRSTKQQLNDQLSHITVPNSAISDFWIRKLQNIEKLQAIKLIRQLVPTNIVGYDNGGPVKKGTFLDYIIDQKMKYPNCIILVRCGDFYETYGIDAIMLVAYCGLNPMGDKCKAGCPKSNIQKTLDSLTSNGFSVAVYEEINHTNTNERKERVTTKKDRKLSQIVSPSNMIYAHNVGSRDDDLDYHESKPVIGLTISNLGYKLIEVHIDKRLLITSERLTLEAVRIMLSQGYAEPIFLCSSLTRKCQSDELSIIKTNYPTTYLTIQTDEVNFSKQLLSHLIEDLDYDSSTINTFRTGVRNNNERPRPIYISTALQIGLLSNPNVNPLIPYLLLSNNNYLYMRSFLLKWLLYPPAYDIANHMQLLCYYLSNLSISLSFQPIMESKVITLLNAKEGSFKLFQEIYENINEVKEFLEYSYDINYLEKEIEHGQIVDTMNYLSNHEYSKIVYHLLYIVESESLIKNNPNKLYQTCNNILKSIIYTIGNINEQDDNINNNLFNNIENKINKKYKKILNNNNNSLINKKDEISKDINKRIPQEFFSTYEEGFRNKVDSQNFPELKILYDGLDQTVLELIEAVNNDIPNDPKNELIFDLNDYSLGLKKIPSNTIIKRKVNKDFDNTNDNDNNSIDDNNIDTSIYIHSRDKNYNIVKSRYTTKKIQSIVDKYIILVNRINEMIKSIYSQLCMKLIESNNLEALIQSSHFAVILQTMISHVKASRQKGWILPKLVNHDNEYTMMKLKGLTPYWIDKSIAISNDIELDGIIFLTAPNMSGKSTLMRSILSSAILGNSGLFIPCTGESNDNILPRYDSYFLRTASYDIPSEGKSAFALEMEDIKIVDRDSSYKSLVMLDEIGKGTSARDGTCMSISILEDLDRKHVKTIFATHLHEISYMNIKFNNIKYKKMDYLITEKDELIHLYKLADGLCTDSLATYTGRLYGVSSSILNRAIELRSLYDKTFHINPNITPNNKSNSTLPDLIETDNNDEHLFTNKDRNEDSDESNETDLSYYRIIEMNDIIKIIQNIAFDFNENVRPIIVKVDEESPPIMEGKTSLYILHITKSKQDNGKLYVGETESITQRLSQHRTARKSYDVSAIVVNVSNKSISRAMETALIKELIKQKYNIESDKDSTHKLFGSVRSKR